MIPSAAYLMFCELTCRLHIQDDDDRHRTRRVIAKLVIHFYPFINDAARLHAEAAITLLLTTATDERLAWECLARCARIDRDERQHQELMTKLGSLEKLNSKAEALLKKMETTYLHDPNPQSPGYVETEVEAAKKRLAEGKYMPWQNAGGPNECDHGYAGGIPCQRCDENTSESISRRTNKCSE